MSLSTKSLVFGEIDALTKSDMRKLMKKLFTKEQLVRQKGSIEAQMKYNESSSDIGRIAAIRACQTLNTKDMKKNKYGKKCLRQTKTEIIDWMVDHKNGAGTHALKTYAKYGLRIKRYEPENKELVKFLAFGFKSWLRYVDNVIAQETDCKVNETTMSFNLRNETFCPLLMSKKSLSKCCERHAELDLDDKIDSSNNADLVELLRYSQPKEKRVPAIPDNQNAHIVGPADGSSAVRAFEKSCDISVPEQHRLVMYTRDMNFVNCFDLRDFNQLISQDDEDPVFRNIDDDVLAAKYGVTRFFTAHRANMINKNIKQHRKIVAMTNGSDSYIVNNIVLPFLTTKWSAGTLASFVGTNVRWVKQQVINRGSAMFLADSSQDIKLSGFLVLKFLTMITCASTLGTHITNPYLFMLNTMHIPTPIPKKWKKDADKLREIINNDITGWYTNTDVWRDILIFSMLQHGLSSQLINDIWGKLVTDDNKEERISVLKTFQLQDSLLLTVSQLDADSALSLLMNMDDTDTHDRAQVLANEQVKTLLQKLGLNEMDLRVANADVDVFSKVMAMIVLPTVFRWILQIFSTVFVDMFPGIKHLQTLAQHVIPGKDALGWYFHTIKKEHEQEYDLAIHVLNQAISVTICGLADLGYIEVNQCACWTRGTSDINIGPWLAYIGAVFD
jgi:hypothetical protein